MSSTDELRRLLDERGVEWTVCCKTTIDNQTYCCGHTFTEFQTGLIVTDLTPEQAIAATLGVGTCHDKGNIERFICSECGCRLDLQDDDWEPTMWLDDGAATVPRFCPNCGRRIEQ